MPYTPYAKAKRKTGYIPFAAKSSTPLQSSPQRDEFRLLREQILQENPDISSEELTNELTRRRFGEQETPNIAFETIKRTPDVAGKFTFGLASFLNSVREEMARSGASVVLTTIAAGVERLGPSITGISQERATAEAEKIRTQTVADNVVAKLVFGNRSLEAIENRIARGEIKVQDFVRGLSEGTIDVPVAGPGLEKTIGDATVATKESLFGKLFGLKKDVSLKDASLPISFIGISGMIGLDFIGGGGKKQVFEAIAKATKVPFIARILKQINVADDLIEPTATRLAKEADKKVVQQALENIDAIQRTTKVVKEAVSSGYVPVKPRAVGAAARAIPDELAQEADKAIAKHPNNLKKAQEEFVEAQKSKPFEETGKFSPTTREARGATVRSVYVQQKTTGDTWRIDFNTNKKTGEKTVEKYVIGEDGQAVISEGKSLEKLQQGFETKDPAEIAKQWTLADDIKNATFVRPKQGVKETDLGIEVQESQLTNIVTQRFNQAVKGGVPEAGGRVAKRIERPTEGVRAERPIAPLREQPRVREDVAVRRRLAKEQQVAARGAKAGERVGKRIGEVRGEEKLTKAVRKEQLKSLKGAIKLRASKDTIIELLKTTDTSTKRVKELIVDHVKEALSIADRGKALTLVKNAKTHKDLVKAFARINRWAEDAIKKGLRDDIINIQRKILDSPSVAVDYKARVKELMGDFELRGHRESTLKRLEETQKFFQSEIAKGNDVTVPKRVLKSLELLNRTPFNEITINQLRGLMAEMELLEGLGRTKFRTRESLIEIQKGKILEEISAQGVKPVQNRKLITPEIEERLTITQKFRNLIWSVANEAARIDKAITPMDTMFDLLDGGRGLYNGANFRFFKGQVDAGYGRYLTRKDALQKPVVELAHKYRLDDTNFERMGVVGAREQDGGLEKLVASGFTKEQVDAVKLTSQEKEVLDLMRSTFDSQFPEIREVMRTVYNQTVEKVKNYFSFMTDWKAMEESEAFERLGSQLPKQFGAPRKNVKADFTRSRVGGDQQIKINALDVFLQHTDNTSYLLELGETSKLLGEVAASPQYAELVGDAGQLLVREWVDVIARKGGAAGGQEIAALNTLRKNVGIGILGLKLSTIAIQPTSLIDGAGFIGGKYALKGVTNFLTNAEWRGFVGKMPEIKDRVGGEFALRELTDKNWFQNIQRKGFIPLQKLDQITAGQIAAGAYERKMIELGREIDFTKYDPEALAYAQLAVRRTQSSGAFKDVPLAVSRGALTGNRSIDRAILQFQNFLLTRWSRIRHDAIRAGVNTKDPKKAVPIFTAIIMASLAASGVRLGVNKIQDFITGREDEDTIEEDLTKGFMYEMTGNVPFIGTAMSMAIYDGEMFPILDAPKGVVSGLNRVITSKSEGAKLRGFAEFAGSLGALVGIPGSSQAEQFLRGALQEEKTSSTREGGSLPGLPSLPKLPSLPSL